MGDELTYYGDNAGGLCVTVFKDSGIDNVAIQHLLRRKDSTRASTQSHGLRDAALWRWVTSGVTGRAGRSAAILPELRSPAWILVSLRARLAPPRMPQGLRIRTFVAQTWHALGLPSCATVTSSDVHPLRGI